MTGREKPYRAMGDNITEQDDDMWYHTVRKKQGGQNDVCYQYQQEQFSGSSDAFR